MKYNVSTGIVLSLVFLLLLEFFVKIYIYRKCWQRPLGGHLLIPLFMQADTCVVRPNAEVSWTVNLSTKLIREKKQKTQFDLQNER